MPVLLRALSSGHGQPELVEERRDPVFEAALARVARPPVPEAWFARFASGPPVPVAVAAASGLAGTAGVVGVAESVEPAVEHVSWDPYLDDSDELQGGEDEVELLEACRRSWRGRSRWPGPGDSSAGLPSDEAVPLCGCPSFF